MNPSSADHVLPRPIAMLREAGVAIWVDDLSRELLRSGELERLVAERGVVGVTTNPTIFASALSQGSSYDEQLAELAGVELHEAAFRITTDDVRDACDVLAPVHGATEGRDGRVSIEVDPDLARDTDATVVMARRLWSTVGRPNLYIKIPATVEGLPAITSALAEGISVNVTLIFSLERYRAVLEAFLTGMEQARQAGRDLDRIASVASFFVSRVDTAVDRELDALGTPEAARLRGTAAIANARLAYQVYEDVIASARWRSLEQSGARPQRPLWASTGVKDAAYSDTRYVDQLVAPGVVNTMPRPTLEAVADHAEIAGDTIRPHYGEAAGRLRALAALGIDLDQITHELEVKGIDAFSTSWHEMLESVRSGMPAEAAG